VFYALKILLKPALIKDQFCVRLVVPNEAQNCNHSTMHQSKDSIKCISKHRLMDTVHDYPFDDDETFNQSCLLNDIHNLFTCSTDAKECFALLTVFDGKKDCADGEDENEKTNEYKFVTDINFQMIYDDVEELSPLKIDRQDETHYKPWPCNNRYTRCDGFWSCENRADYINCSPSICSGSGHALSFRMINLNYHV
jgi:hypothetical protein